MDMEIHVIIPGNQMNFILDATNIQGVHNDIKNRSVQRPHK